MADKPNKQKTSQPVCLSTKEEPFLPINIKLHQISDNQIWGARNIKSYYKHTKFIKKIIKFIKKDKIEYCLFNF